jgi:hypothetical protein
MATGMKILAMWSDPKSTMQFRKMLEKEGIRVREFTIVEDVQYQSAVNILAENEEMLQALEKDYLFIENKWAHDYGRRLRTEHLRRQYADTGDHNGEGGK